MIQLDWRFLSEVATILAAFLMVGSVGLFGGAIAWVIYIFQEKK